MSLMSMAEDHVMAATKGSKSNGKSDYPDTLSLNLKEAQDFAVDQNRTLKNASLAVQEAYAQRWQTIAAMLPQVDGSYSYNDYLGYKATMSMMGRDVEIGMPNQGSLVVTASVGINGQGIVGALLNNVAIDMKKISLEKSEVELRGSVMTSYVSLLALQSITELLDSSLVNIEELERMTQNAVDAGASEQTTADQIHVRVNTMRNNINVQRNNIALAYNSLKVLLDVPVETYLILEDDLDAILSPEAVLNLYTNQQYYGDGGMRMTPPNVIQVGVRLPLWSSGKRAAGVVEKKIAYQEALNTLSETTDQLAIQYNQLCYNLSSAYQTYMTDKESLEVAQRVFASITQKYKFGASSMLELTNSSNDLINAQSTYVQAMLSLVNAQVELEQFLNN